jgi:excisionase family DNA binding protein
MDTKGAPPSWSRAGTGTEQRALLTTTEAGRLLGVSRQTIVSMCDSGDLPFTQVGTHRRIDPESVRALRERTRRKPVAARRSLWLAHAVAGALVQEPDRVLAAARGNLQTMQSAGPRGMSRQWLNRWQRLLEGPIEPILDALTGPTVEHDELRQHSPLTAALSQQQRDSVLQAFAERRHAAKRDGATP